MPCTQMRPWRTARLSHTVWLTSSRGWSTTYSQTAASCQTMSGTAMPRAWCPTMSTRCQEQPAGPPWQSPMPMSRALSAYSVPSCGQPRQGQHSWRVSGPSFRVRQQSGLSAVQGGRG
jgi:hypothetical protein